MADLKVIKPQPQTQTQTNGEGPLPHGIDPKKTFNENDPKALKLEEDLENLQKTLVNTKYKVKTTLDVLNYLIDDFYPNVEWAGYECYAIHETFTHVEKIANKTKPSKTGKVGFTFKPEILEALFHFIKKHTGTGVTAAESHRKLCEDFSVTMAQLNTDRQKLRELSCEVEAAKHGITVDEYKKAINAAQPNPNNMNLPHNG